MFSVEEERLKDKGVIQSYWKGNFPMTPPVRLLVGRLDD